MTTANRGQKTVLVTGANGYIGNAVARAFQRAGYRTYRLVRSLRSAPALEKNSIVPIIGSAADPEAVLLVLRSHTSMMDVIVSTTEDVTNYVPHFNDSIALLRLLAEASSASGTRPLVLFTSGCKDYGRGELQGSPGLTPYTEESPLRPPAFLRARATHATKVFEHRDIFDAAVLRPTNVHGYASSYFGLLFEMAANAKQKSETLQFATDPRTIMHSVHVDDCAEGYVALAEYQNRSQVDSECFNISAGKRYETMQDIADGLVEIYGFPKKAGFNPPDPSKLENANPLIAFSQWVGSEKLRNLTGWAECKPMFAEDMVLYKREYDFAVKEDNEGVARIKARFLK